MELDYEKLGFKCGVEVHQQLEGKKLFCNCQTLNIREGGDIKVVRRLRAVAGETGEVDAAAKHEMIKDKEFIYLGDSADVCLVETDSEPPHKINADALEIALQVAKMLNVQAADEIQVMRKTVVDGSNTSGFQRTALIGDNGFIETSKGKVRIANLCLEEEACQKVKEDENSVTYRLDRLGIPLLEIGTETDIKDAEHAKEVAGMIGMILRSTGKVKRGLGTIRQDVNISIKGHPRIEIKGFQDLRSIPKVIEKEIERELDEIKSKKKLEAHVRKAEPDFSTSFMRPMPGAARMYPETDVAPIKVTKKMLDEVKVPELISEKVVSIEKDHKIPEELARELVKTGRLGIFEEVVKEFKNVKPIVAATILTSTMKEILRRHHADILKLKEEDIKELFGYLDREEISKDVIAEVMLDYIKGDFKLSKYKQVDDSKIEKEIKDIAEKNKGASFGALMGMVMGKFKGKVDGKKVSEILKKYI